MKSWELVLAALLILMVVGFIWLVVALALSNIEKIQTHELETSIANPNPASMYGCPGCPQNFMGFAQDVCSRFGSTYTVSDGINTIECYKLSIEKVNKT